MDGDLLGPARDTEGIEDGGRLVVGDEIGVRARRPVVALVVADEDRSGRRVSVGQGEDEAIVGERGGGEVDDEVVAGFSVAVRIGGEVLYERRPRRRDELRCRGAGGVGIRRVAGGTGGEYPIGIGGRGAQAAVRVADCCGAGYRDLGEADVVGRALDLDAGLGARGVGPGEVDLGAAGCRGREVGGSGRRWRRWTAGSRLEGHHLHHPRARGAQRSRRVV